MNSNDVKANALGEPYGTATSRLRKMLLFDYAQRCNEDICYRCETKITSIKDFTTEHKKPWLHSDDPIKWFFDLDNIAFSHMSCNSGAAERHKKWNSQKEWSFAMSRKRQEDQVLNEHDKAVRRVAYIRGDNPKRRAKSLTKP